MPENFNSRAVPTFLFDVDNTLLDNDRFAADLGAQLTAQFGADEERRYWRLYDELRGQLVYADYLATAQRFREGLEEHPALLRLSHFLLDYLFSERLFPRALEVLAGLRRQAPVAILSDGDVVFQPHKIRAAGLWQAVEGQVLIYVHKQQMLPAMQRRLPAPHYVMVDDKPQILAAMKRIMGDMLTTVFVRQGHYALAGGTESPAPDIAVQSIAELLQIPFQHWQVSA